MPARTLMIQGTSSSAGKSLLVTALCRIFTRRGLRVVPFKAQNMSNNAAVCADGAEIGRAQALQAAAAGIAPTADMNPILLKPEGNTRSQVIVLGKTWQTLSARRFYQAKNELWAVVAGALARLRALCDLVIIEGAGSPVELNLRDGDIVNMAVARQAEAPVLLVGDIDRGGIFAQLLGTLWLLEPEGRALVRGLVVNKFRGDPSLFASGVRLLEERAETPVLGVVPYVDGLNLPEEDAVALFSDSRRGEIPLGRKRLDLAVIRLPHIANFDDFDPLRLEADVCLRYADSPAILGRPDAILLPGTKSTMADLEWLAGQGLVEAIRCKAAEGIAVVGICGGYQMLGRRILDPEQVESTTAAMEAIGLLPVETTFARTKASHQVQARIRGGAGWLADLAGAIIVGYEIHMGNSPSDSCWLEITERSGTRVSLPDGAVSDTGRVWGCYIHGIFANDGFRRAWLGSLRGGRSPATLSPENPSLDASLDRLADVVTAALDMDRIEEILNNPAGGLARQR